MLQWILDFFTEYANTPMYERTLGQDAWFIVLIGLIAVTLGTVGTVCAVLIYKLIQWVKGK